MAIEKEDRKNTVDEDPEDDEIKDSEGDEDDLDDDEPSDDPEGDDDTPSGDELDDKEDDKPLTARALKNVLKPLQDQIAVLKRHSQKGAKGNRYQSGKPAAGKDGADVVAKRLDNVELMERKRTFGYENQLSPDEVDVIFRVTKNPTKKTLEDPFIQGGLEKLRSKKSANANIPSGHGSRKFGTEGKSWDKMTPEERQQHFKDKQSSILAGKKRG